MQYYGAEHYFFWRGVERAQNSPRLNLEREVNNLIALELKIAEKCREAFTWGFFFGCALTKKEYEHLTIHPECNRVKREYNELDKKYYIEGNC